MVRIRGKQCATCPFRCPEPEEMYAGALKRADAKSYLQCHELPEDGLKQEQIMCAGYFARGKGAAIELMRRIGLEPQVVTPVMYRHLIDVLGKRRKRRWVKPTERT